MQFVILYVVSCPRMFPYFMESLTKVQLHQITEPLPPLGYRETNRNKVSDCTASTSSQLVNFQNNGHNSSVTLLPTRMLGMISRHWHLVRGMHLSSVRAFV